MTTRRNAFIAFAVDHATPAAIERLEDRRLFAVSVSPLGNIAGSPGESTTVNAAAAFDDDTATFVQVATSLGDYRVQLFDNLKPGTVQNFLRYVNSDRYDNLIIHRSDPLSGDASAAPDIIQGGGYVFPGFNHVNTFPPIGNEFTDNRVISNTRGTLAMAKTSDPDSATSEWFVNLRDNSGALDDPNNSGGFTVFGKVVDEDMPVIDAIAALPRFTFQGPFSAIPLRSYTDADQGAAAEPTENNVVKTITELVPDLLTYSVSSSDPTLATATVDAGGQVALAYGDNAGTATITVEATGLDGTTTSSTAFDVGIGQFDVLVGGDSGNKSVSYTDANGTFSTVTLKGAGTATVRFTGGDLSQSTKNGKVSVTGTGTALGLVSIAGSDSSTVVNINTRGGNGVTTLDVLSADGALKSLSGKKVHLIGAVTTVGAVGAVNLLSANGAALSLGGNSADQGAKVIAGDFVDTDIVSGSPLASVKLKSASGTDEETDVISAPGIGNLNIAGDSSANITSVGEPNINKVVIGGNYTGTMTAHQIVSLLVKGSLSGATINATHEANERANAQEANQKENQAIGKLVVKQDILNSVIDTAGSVGSIAAASIASSRVFVGLLGQTLLPTSLAQMSQEATLNSLKVKGPIMGSDIAGRYLGTIQAGTINTDNGGAPFGLTTDSIQQLKTTTTAGAKLQVKNVTTQAEFDAAATGIDLGDLTVTVL